MISDKAKIQEILSKSFSIHIKEYEEVVLCTYYKNRVYRLDQSHLDMSGIDCIRFDQRLNSWEVVRVKDY